MALSRLADPRIGIEKGEQVAQIVLLQLGPGNAEGLRAPVHFRSVAPQGSREGDLAGAASAQGRSQRSAPGVGAVAAAAAPGDEDAVARLRRAAGLEIAQA